MKKKKENLDRLSQSASEMILTSAALLNDVLASIREHIHCLYNLVEVISNCDLLASIANYAMETSTGNVFLRNPFVPIS